MADAFQSDFGINFLRAFVLQDRRIAARDYDIKVCLGSLTASLARSRQTKSLKSQSVLRHEWWDRWQFKS
jgi:hypothetical protein